jgi:hypothetical protein
MTKIAGSKSSSQRHGSADPDPHKSFMDPEHCKISLSKTLGLNQDPDWIRIKQQPRFGFIESRPVTLITVF